MGANMCKVDGQVSKCEVVVNNGNPLHMKKMDARPELARAPPSLQDFKGTPSKGASKTGLFEDAEFPATNASIGGVTGDAANPNVAQYLEEMMKLVVPGWARPRQMVGKEAGEYKLFATEGEPCLFARVSPRDIQQGYLGDCWLVSSMATLAEYPDRVRSLFKQNTLTEDGRYDVRLYDPTSEEWKVVTIDDRLPFWQRPGKHGNLCFAKQTKENEFWPCLLEKAVAKFVMSYHRIDGGFESVAMEMLTGKPSVCVGLSQVPGGAHAPYALLCGQTPQTAKHATVLMRKEAYDAHWGYWGQDASALLGGKKQLSDDELWDMLKDWDKVGYSLACGSRCAYKGILQGHAYTVLRLLDVPIDRKDKQGKEEKFTLKMLHVRNPHRTNEWFGRFHDDDWETWNKYPEALKACAHKVGVKDNGVFWMEWTEFKHGFRDVGICFDKQSEGTRYTDNSKAAIKEHQGVKFGQVGYQKWEGL
ncbi:unnamed protein product [Effrenium voratum]|uniref:Calpain catalytic domain-containing protein n=1 Tax=Effrenium voratum TaxID=2562239 RepID=A0AA36NBM3_9DINO|nr:unnamed protein product [Effrenium voratum]CAJ1458696.1 unnamed protein product [Effrenium voratum]